MADQQHNEMLATTEKNLIGNGFLVSVVNNAEEAKELFYSSILNETAPRSISYADSLTLRSTGILDGIRLNPHYTFIETFSKENTWDENIEQRRKALTVDLFLTGSNAVTEVGQIINLDMIGNRTAAITFGPRNVVLFIGINKIVKDIKEGMKRVREVSAPQNAIRHRSFALPCQKTGYCVDCHSEKRICNAWSIMEKSYPKKRIRVVLIKEELGL